MTASYGYDQAGRLTGLIHTAASDEIDRITYSHDWGGNRLSRTTPDNKNLYSYDNLYRLVQTLPIMLQGKGKEHPKKASDFTYDQVGNRQTGPERKDYFNYNQGNQLTNDRKHQYAYDGNGNIISKAETDDDGENRLISAVKQEENETKTVSFKYDPFGRRIEKAVTAGSTTTTKRYFYDNEDIIFEYDEGGDIGNRYTHGPGIDEPLSVTTDSGTYYYHADGLGSITALTDSDQKVVQEYEYDAFGNLHDEKNTVKQPYTFTGREWDKEIKLYYYRARYYDPKIGRFISFDPIAHPANGPPRVNAYTQSLSNSSLDSLKEHPQTLNPYIYVTNNPTNFLDPFGLQYGTSDCSYYQMKCEETGNYYYCYAANAACASIRIPITNWDQCVRQCLQEYDQKYCQDSCGEFDLSCTFTKAHSYCFKECFSDPNTQPPFPPGAPLQ